MKLVVIGGHSRSVGKTSLAAGIIAATSELAWTALKITQFGHGICSAHGHDCDCAIEEPDCPYAITRETSMDSGTDTSRFLAAGAKDVYWVRTRVGQLDHAIPELRRMLAEREFVIMESNSILRFLDPDVYIPVLHFGIEDFKLSSRLYLKRADAFAVVEKGSGQAQGPVALWGPGNAQTRVAGSAAESWPGVNLELLGQRPTFSVGPPSYCSAEVVEFVSRKLGAEHRGATSELDRGRTL